MTSTMRSVYRSVNAFICTCFSFGTIFVVFSRHRAVLYRLLSFCTDQFFQYCFPIVCHDTTYVFVVFPFPTTFFMPFNNWLFAWCWFFFFGAVHHYQRFMGLQTLLFFLAPLSNHKNSCLSINFTVILLIYCIVTCSRYIRSRACMSIVGVICLCKPVAICMRPRGLSFPVRTVCTSDVSIRS